MLTDTAKDLKELGGRDPYRLLGLQRGATADEVRQAFRRQVISGAHPDRGGDDATFRTLTRARDVLLDPQRRADYDSALGSGTSRRTQPVPGSPPSSPYRGPSAPPTATATRPAPEPPAAPQPANAGMPATSSGIGAPGAFALVFLLLGPLAWPVAIVVVLIGLWLTRRTGRNSR